MHFDLRSLQKSHARLTLTGFRRRLCIASSAPGDVSECPRLAPAAPAPGDPEAGVPCPRGVAPSGLVDAANISLSVSAQLIACQARVEWLACAGRSSFGGVCRPDKGFPMGYMKEMEKLREGVVCGGAEKDPY